MKDLISKNNTVTIDGVDYGYLFQGDKMFLVTTTYLLTKTKWLKRDKKVIETRKVVLVTENMEDILLAIAENVPNSTGHGDVFYTPVDIKEKIKNLNDEFYAYMKVREDLQLTALDLDSEIADDTKKAMKKQFKEITKGAIDFNTDSWEMPKYKNHFLKQFTEQGWTYVDGGKDLIIKRAVFMKSNEDNDMQILVVRYYTDKDNKAILLTAKAYAYPMALLSKIKEELV